MLFRSGIDKIVLVTDVWHMGRSQLAFRHYGLTALAAPTDFPTGFFREPPPWWQPSIMLLPMNMFGLSECFGQIKYRLRYAINDPVVAPASGP